MVKLKKTLSVVLACLAWSGASAAVAQDDAPPSADYVLTPAGWSHKSCGRIVSDNAKVVESADGSLQVTEGQKVSSIARCKFAPKFRGRFFKGAAGKAVPTINGWLEFSSFWAPANGGKNWMSGLDGQWVVPTAPTSNGATIFFFNSMEPSSGSTIIQPVLQYGSSAAGGGNSWKIASWYVKSDGTFAVSPLRSVSVGDTIRGTMSSTGCSSSGDCNWVITTSTDTQISTLRTAAGSDVFKWVQPAVLEVYGVNTCSKLPNATGTAFSGTYAYQPTASDNNGRAEMATALTWTANTASASVSPSCDYGVSNFSRGTTLSY